MVEYPRKQRGLPSVKHMTCFFWFQGRCRYSDDQCLYAHHYTGRMAGQPKPTEAGRPAVAGQNARSSQPVYTDWRGLNNLQRSTSGSQIRHTQLRLPANESTANRSFSNPFMHPEAYVSATAMVGPATARSVSNITTASPRAIGSERNTHRPQLNMNVPHLERPPPESMVSVSTGLLDELEYCRQAMKAQGRILEHCTSQLQLASSVLTRAMQCLSTTTNFGIVDGTTLTEDKKKLHAVVSTVCGVAKEHEKLIELLEMVQK